jgi:hypothetical protein
MKKRVSSIINFFAFNLLFFALYLNFIHKDSNTIPTTPQPAATISASRTVLVENPEQYLKKENRNTKADDQLAKLSFN